MPSPGQRLLLAEQLATDNGWVRRVMDAPPFLLTAFTPDPLVSPLAPPHKIITIYIEGDGYAWRTRSRPSSDPTPIDPVALKLALRHPGGAAAYLARPCQFVAESIEEGCERRYWTSDRFSVEVVDAENRAVTELKKAATAEAVRLVGYSGGGAVAALIAARRDDVKELITVAGNLDHRFWTESKRLSPLSGSMNAVEHIEGLQQVPQIHLFGGADQIIDPEVGYSYQRSFPRQCRPKVEIFSEYTHHCCWVENWPKIYRDVTKALQTPCDGSEL